MFLNFDNVTGTYRKTQATKKIDERQESIMLSSDKKFKNNFPFFRSPTASIGVSN